MIHRSNSGFKFLWGGAAEAPKALRLAGSPPCRTVDDQSLRVPAQPWPPGFPAHRVNVCPCAQLPGSGGGQVFQVTERTRVMLSDSGPPWQERGQWLCPQGPWARTGAPSRGARRTQGRRRLHFLTSALLTPGSASAASTVTEQPHCHPRGSQAFFKGTFWERGMTKPARQRATRGRCFGSAGPAVSVPSPEPASVERTRHRRCMKRRARARSPVTSLTRAGGPGASLPSPVLGDTLRKRRRGVTGFCYTFTQPCCYSQHVQTSDGPASPV